jgi:2-polyprenyl-3-methyl-5-hydroxy-6-metoxy-1,4-benzoquinol methylase
MLGSFKNVLVFGAVLAATILAPGAARSAAISPTLKSKLAAQLNEERLAHLYVSQMLEVMGISQAKAVLEVGAGAGILALPMAEALKGKGSVVATDADQELVGYLGAEAKKKSLDNLTVQLIDEKAPGFKAGTFDRLVMLSVVEYLKDQTAFLKAILPSLQKGARVCIIHPKLYPAISPKRRMDLGYLASKLQLEGARSPLAPYLSKEALAFINQGEKADLKAPGFAALVAELNGLMENPMFVKSFVDSKYPVTPSALKGNEGKTLETLKKQLKGKLGSKADKLSAEEKIAFRTLGWLALKGRYVAPSGAMVGYDFTGPTPDPRDLVLAKAKKAGLVLESESDLLPFHYFLIFKVQ